MKTTRVPEVFLGERFTGTRKSMLFPLIEVLLLWFTGLALLLKAGCVHVIILQPHV